MDNPSKHVLASELSVAWSNLSALEVLESALARFGEDKMAFVSSFGAESAVLLSLAARISPDLKIIFIETGFHFDETQRYAEQLIDRLGLTRVVRVSIDPITRKRIDPDQRLHQVNPDLCCHIRKVEVLDRALKGLNGWVSGQKRYQDQMRAGVELLEFDSERDCFKVNPLAHWTAKRIEGYFQGYGLPRHPLIASGYASIGCWPCTSPVKAGESVREGRWRGQAKTECGLHRPLRHQQGGMS